MKNKLQQTESNEELTVNNVITLCDRMCSMHIIIDLSTDCDIIDLFTPWYSWV
jgi:hypothetical protein